VDNRSLKGVDPLRCQSNVRHVVALHRWINGVYRTFCSTGLRRASSATEALAELADVTIAGTAFAAAIAAMTPLQKPLKRLLTINGDDYVITLAPDGLKLTEKGKRKGIELRWEALVSGEAALAVALRASINTDTARSK
jgi:hypothetical protein